MIRRLLAGMLVMASSFVWAEVPATAHHGCGSANWQSRTTHMAISLVITPDCSAAGDQVQARHTRYYGGLRTYDGAWGWNSYASSSSGTFAGNYRRGRHQGVVSLWASTPLN